MDDNSRQIIDKMIELLETYGCSDPDVYYPFESFSMSIPPSGSDTYHQDRIRVFSNSTGLIKIKFDQKFVASPILLEEGYHEERSYISNIYFIVKEYSSFEEAIEELELLGILGAGLNIKG